MNGYDAIVVGARCGGSPTAMLLARQGYRVLLVDQATFPSDTISTHLIHPPGISALRAWGLLERVIATGCPGIDTYVYDLGPFTISGRPGTDESPLAYAPRRTVLDKLLVDAASEAGVEVRQEFTVTSVVSEDGRVTGVRGHRKGGSTLTERARVVVGADGHHSLVARSVDPQRYHSKPALQVSYYAYVRGLPMDGRFEVYLRPDRGFAAWPTNDEQTVVIGGWPRSELATNRKDVEGNFHATLDLVPEFAARFHAGKRATRFVGMSVENFLRKPFGPGWALVGDAGYTKDFITGLGISDAFRDAGLCARALDEALSGARPFEEAMAAYQCDRDRLSLPFYEFTTQLATLQPLPPELERVLETVHGDPAAMDAFARVGGAVTSPADFFSGERPDRIVCVELAARGIADRSRPSTGKHFDPPHRFGGRLDESVQTHHRCVPAGSGRRARPSLSHDSRRNRRRAGTAGRAPAQPRDHPRDLRGEAPRARIARRRARRLTNVGGAYWWPTRRAVRKRSSATADARSSSRSRSTLVGLEPCIFARYNAARSR